MLMENLKTMKTPIISLLKAFANSRLILCGFLVLLSVLCWETSYAQQQKLYIGTEDLGPGIKAFLNQNNIQHVYSFNVIGDDLSQVDRNKISAAIIKQLPDQSSDGIGVLDWEGAAFNQLKNGNNATLQDFITLLNWAKKLRPKVKWGFYNIPFSTYYHRDADWRQSCSNIMPLLQLCDVFCPSLYTPYKNGTNSPDDNESYARDVVYEALSLAGGTGKPVLPFIWHRYHVSNRKDGLKLIPYSEFNKYLITILKTSYNGQRVAGVIWWSSESYYFKLNGQNMTDEFRSSGQSDFKAYDDQLMIGYGKEISNTIKSVN
jgi:glycosyl hydrolase family 56 (putative hyaluronidase)